MEVIGTRGGDDEPALVAARPNPFVRSTQIADTLLAVYDVRGRLCDRVSLTRRAWRERHSLLSCAGYRYDRNAFLRGFGRHRE